MKITLDSRIVASRARLASNIGSETIIAGFEKGNYYALGAVGARVWQLVQAPVVARDVQRAIAEEYDVNREQSDRDVLALLNQMAEERLIEVARDDA